MASGAIPPGFPPIEIDGEQYWDGGLFSNTPLAYMVDYYPRRSRLIFQVDVFPAHGRAPTILPRSLSAIKIFGIPAVRALLRIICVKSIMCDTPSTSCTNYCRRSSPTPNRPSDFMPTAV